jgi:hypothetical protein
LPDLKFEPINAEIRSVTLQDDAEEGLTAIVAWTGKPPDTAKVLQFEFGAQGTWARLLLSDGSSTLHNTIGNDATFMLLHHRRRNSRA